MIHYVAEHARLNLHEAGTFRLSRLRKGPGVRFSDSIFGKLLEPINRRQFQAVVDRLDGDSYDKSFKSWDHLVALIYAQLSGNNSLRAVVEGFNANPQHHYHLGTKKLRRSTLSDANAVVRSAFLRKSLPPCRRWPVSRPGAKAWRWCA